MIKAKQVIFSTSYLISDRLSWWQSYHFVFNLKILFRERSLNIGEGGLEGNAGKYPQIGSPQCELSQKSQVPLSRFRKKSSPLLFMKVEFW